MRYPVVNLHRMGGMLEDYQNEINNLKAKLNPGGYSQPGPTPAPYVPQPPEPPPSQPPPMPSGSGSVGCYTRPDGSGYWGPPEPGAVANNLTEFQCRGIERAQPLEPPPKPATTSDIDLPGTGMPPIMVQGGDEVPPPVPTLPPHPGAHAPVSTGIPTGEYGWPPLSYPPVPEPGPYTGPCPRGFTRTTPGGPCLPNVPSKDRFSSPSLPSIPGGLFSGDGATVSLFGLGAPLLMKPIRLRRF